MCFFLFLWVLRSESSGRNLLACKAHVSLGHFSLAKSEGGRGGNWYALDSAGPHSTWRKYYINVCRPLNPVPGCDRYASACQMKYESHQVGLPPAPCDLVVELVISGLPGLRRPGC